MERILAERIVGDGIRWQAVIGGDCGRLEVVCVVAPRTETIVIPMLSDVELRELLSTGASETEEAWRCQECGHINAKDRRWCTGCSGHTAA